MRQKNKRLRPYFEVGHKIQLQPDTRLHAFPSVSNYVKGLHGTIMRIEQRPDPNFFAIETQEGWQEFRRFISQLRKQHQCAGTASALTLDASGAQVHVPPNSPPRASWLCMCQPDRLDEKQRQRVEQIRAAHRDLDTPYQLSQAFVAMLAERRAQDLDNWLIQAKQSGIRELKSFAEAHPPRLRRRTRGVHFTLEEWPDGGSGQLADRFKNGSCSVAPILTYDGSTSCVAREAASGSISARSSRPSFK